MSLVRKCAGPVALVAMAWLGTGCTQLTAEPERFSSTAPGRIERTVHYPKGDWSESVLMLRETGPEKVRLGEEFEYVIEVYNPTDDVVLKNVVLSKYVDDNLQLMSSTPQWEDVNVYDQLFDRIESDHDLEDADVQRPAISRHQVASADKDSIEGYESPEVRWYIGELYPEKMVTIRVRAKAKDEGVINGCASASYELATCLPSKVVSPELKLNSSMPDSYTLCVDGPLQAQFKLKNTGSGTVQNAKLKVDLPDGMSYNDRSMIVETVGTLKPGASKTVTKTLNVEKAGYYTISAEAVGGGNLKADLPEHKLRVRRGDLDIDVSGPQETYVGLPVEFDVKVRNSGDAALREVIVRNQIPQGLQLAEASHGGTQQSNDVVWRLGTLPAKQSKTLTVRFENTGQEARTIRNVAYADDPCAGQVSDTARVKLQGVAAMVVEVVDTKDPNKIGENEVYEIKVTNQGSKAETNVVVRCELPMQQSFVMADGPTATGASRGAQQVTFSPLASLEPGQTATWKVTVKCQKTGDLRFKVEVDSDQHGQPVYETEAPRVFD